YLHILIADCHPPLAKIDLQLLAWRRLKANRCPRFRLQFAPQVTHLPLDRPQRQPDPLLLLELLANHITVAAAAPEPPRHPSVPRAPSPPSPRGRPPPR